MLPPALRMSLGIRSRCRNVKALIMEEGETFDDPDVGYRAYSYFQSNLTTCLTIVVLDLQVRVCKDVVKRHVGSFPYFCKFSEHMGRKSSSFELFLPTP